MSEFSKTDKLFTALSIILIIASVGIYITLPEMGKPLLVYLFISVSLMISVITTLVMAGFTYSIGKDKEQVEFTGKEGILRQFTKTTEQDQTLLLGLVAALSLVLVIINVF